MARLVVALFIGLLASISVYLILVGSEDTAGYGLTIGLDILPLLVFLGPIFVWLQGLFFQHGRRWYLVNESLERGPFSLHQLGRMKKNHELPSDARIRRRWSKCVSRFDILTRPPERVAGGLVGLALGAVAGGLLGYFLFGQISTPTALGIGHWVQVEHVFVKPSANGSLTAMLRKSAVDSAANSNIPGVKEFGSFLASPEKQVQEAMNAYFSAIDRIRFSSMIGAMLGCLITAGLLRESYSIARARERTDPMRIDRG